MKRVLPVSLAVLVVLVLAVTSFASTPRIVLTHALPVATDHGRTLTFPIHVENAGDAPLSNLTLSFQPRPPFIKMKTEVSVGNLGARQGTDISVKLTTLATIPAGDISSRGGLLFTAKYLDTKGEAVAVPALSRLLPVERLKSPARTSIAPLLPAAAPVQAGPGAYLLQIGARYHFETPLGVAVDAGGNVYVTDANHVQKFDSSGNILVTWGGSGSGYGQFADPAGVTVDGNGNVYVADMTNDRIQKFDGNGTFLAAWGSYGTGNGQFNTPTSVAVDRSGNVYVVDNGNRRIQKFDGSGAFLAVWDNLDFPAIGVAVAPSGEVYVTDSGTTLRKFDGSGNFLASWTVSTFDRVTGVAVDNTGKVYVAAPDAIRVYDSSGNLLNSFGSFGPGNGQFNYPWSLAVDAGGNVWVADTSNDRIEKFDAGGNFVSVWASHGSEKGTFYNPRGVAVDRSGNIYVADTHNNRIQKFDSSGNFLTTWGSEGSGNGQFSYPMGVAVDDSGNVYVADTRNLRIQVFDSSGTFIRVLTYGEWVNIGPVAIALDREANIYAADIEGQYIEKFSNAGNFLFRTHGCVPFDPSNDGGFLGVAVDNAGNIYATDTASYSVQKLDRNGNCIAVWDRFFEGPVGIAVDNSADVYVVDGGAANVSVLDSDGVFRATFGSLGPSNGEFVSPTGVATDKPGSRIYVADTSNNRIQVFTGYGATHFAVSAPSSAAAGKPISFTVTALDAADETVTRYGDTVRFTSSDATAKLPNPSTLTDGTGTFPATLTKPGNQTITAIDTAAAWAKGTSNTIDVTGPSKVADLTIAKHHRGQLWRGERGTYTITVKNSGSAATTGAVKVTDRLPAGLTATAIFGRGWTCTKDPLSCTTTRVLAPGAVSLPITLSVNVAHDAPSYVTNTATVSGGGELNTSNDTATDTAKVKHRHGHKK